MRFRYSSTVRNSVENVWDFVMDFGRRPEWIHFFEKCYITHQTDDWVGTKYKEKSVFLGIPLYIEYTITDYVEKQRLASICKMAPFYPKVEISIVDNGDGTVESILEFEIKLGPFFLVPKKLIKSQVDQLVHPVVETYVDLIHRPD